MKFRCLLLCLLSALGCSSGASYAQVLMLDFGPTEATGASQTNSPYHAVNPSFTGSTWNMVGTTDVASGLVYSNGASATGLSLNLGTAGANTSTINLAGTPSGSSALGSLTNTGIYAATSVGKDGIWNGNNDTDKRYVGFQLGGLAAGTYDVYVTSRNTSQGDAYGQNLYMGTSSSTGNFDATALSLNGTLSYGNSSAATSAWALDSNYIKFSVTLGADSYINFGVTGTGGDLRGFINSVQIVAVPEPSSTLLLAGGLLVVTVFRRRGKA